MADSFESFNWNILRKLKRVRWIEWRERFALKSVITSDEEGFDLEFREYCKERYSLE